jgi:hypothetical protein
VEPSPLDELAFFRAIAESGARALLIGRRALVVLGLPVLTADYDYWIAIDDGRTVAFEDLWRDRHRGHSGAGRVSRHPID